MSIQRRTYKKKDGRVSNYYVAFAWLGSGKRITKQFERKLDAEAWELDQLHAFKNGHSLVAKDSNKTVKELGEHWLENYAKKRKEGSSKIRDEIALRRQIYPYFGSKRLLDLNTVEVESWQEKLRDEGLAPKTVNNCLGLFKKMLSDAVKWRFIRFNPIREADPLPLGELDFNFWTPDECRKFMGYAHEQDLGTYYVVGIALYTGMRLGEIHGLQWDCVDFNSRYITVKRTYCLKEERLKETTKTKRICRVPINGPLLDILVELRSAVSLGYVVPNYDFEHASRNLRRRAGKADVKPIRFHDLRHTFASLFLMNGGPIYKLQRILGHTTVQMTERYSHLSPEHLTGATEMLDFGSGQTAEVVPIREAREKESERARNKIATKKIPDENFVREFKKLKNRGGGN